MTAVTEETVREEKATDWHYEKAQGFILKAQEQGFRDKTLLEKAYDMLMLALKNHPEHQDALLLTSQLMHLIELPQLAQQYLNKLLTLNPEHEGGLAFQALINREPLHPVQAWMQDLEAYAQLRFPQSSEEFDFIYDETEAFIQAQVTYFMQQSPPQEPVVDEQLREAQELILSQILQVQTLVDEQMLYLQEEFQIQELEDMRKPLSTLQQRYEQVVWFNGVFDVLQDGCLGIQQDAVALLKELQQIDGETSSEAFDQKLQALMDLCDSLADDLDSIGQQVSIVSILPHYNKALDYVKHLQDTLDQRYV